LRAGIMHKIINRNWNQVWQTLFWNGQKQEDRQGFIFELCSLVISFN
jgi:hypothetical protein